jgi:hypothetical protein
MHPENKFSRRPTVTVRLSASNSLIRNILPATPSSSIFCQQPLQSNPANQNKAGILPAVVEKNSLRYQAPSNPIATIALT